MTKVLAVTSGGGHWEEMMALRPNLAGFDIVYANTFPGLSESYAIERCHIIADCNRDAPLKIVCCARDIFKLVARERPDVVISTGAAPGLIAVFTGKLFGAKTIWLDSLANASELSLSGRLAGYFVDLWLTQWKHLSKDKGPHYWGNIL